MKIKKQDKYYQHTVAQNKYFYSKREEYRDTKRWDWTKARHKPSRATVKSYSSMSSIWTCHGEMWALKDWDSLVPVALLVAVHLASLLAGSACCLQLFSDDIPYSWCLTSWSLHCSFRITLIALNIACMVF